jgi:hypothetical protein
MPDRSPGCSRHRPGCQGLPASGLALFPCPLLRSHFGVRSHSDGLQRGYIADSAVDYASKNPYPLAPGGRDKRITAGRGLHQQRGALLGHEEELHGLT